MGEANQPMKSRELRTRVEDGVMDMVDRVAAAQGRDRGEYLRALVIDDLDRRGMITQRLRGISPNL